MNNYYSEEYGEACENREEFNKKGEQTIREMLVGKTIENVVVQGDELQVLTLFFTDGTNSTLSFDESLADWQMFHLSTHVELNPYGMDDWITGSFLA